MGFLLNISFLVFYLFVIMFNNIGELGSIVFLLTRLVSTRVQKSTKPLKSPLFPLSSRMFSMAELPMFLIPPKPKRMLGQFMISNIGGNPLPY